MNIGKVKEWDWWMNEAYLLTLLHTRPRCLHRTFSYFLNSNWVLWCRVEVWCILKWLYLVTFGITLWKFTSNLSILQKNYVSNFIYRRLIKIIFKKDYFIRLFDEVCKIQKWLLIFLKNFSLHSSLSICVWRYVYSELDSTDFYRNLYVN